MSELRYLREVWLKRAEVAKECAGELGALRAQLDGVVTRNYFGMGCVEGVELYERLRTVIRSGIQDLEANRISAVALDVASRGVVTSIEAADGEAVGGVR
ncbi:MAG: hypothetical protein WBA38_15255 [Gordonia sp. (in: high G+C Gram-positive bacteria)]|uniref:hypothetical protein n=1 Tax=Gordonia sp. (in: high G+C Gram-positive bacteria) TaxID=84139 RepID=UPI003C7193AA